MFGCVNFVTFSPNFHNLYGNHPAILFMRLKHALARQFDNHQPILFTTRRDCVYLMVILL